MDNDSLLQRASSLAENGNFDLARKFVIQAIKNNQQDLEAWWAMAHVARTDKERNRAVSKVLQLDPSHPHALHMRDQIRAGSIPPLDYGGSVDAPKPAESDFLAKSLITLFAYFFMYVVGLGLNLYFLKEARTYQSTHGVKPDNMGCLWAMLAVSVGIPVVLCALITGLAMFGMLLSL